MLPMDASGIEDPERWISLVTQAFSDIPENIRNMLLREGWSVCIKSETLDHRGSGTVIGQAIFADHRLETNCCIGPDSHGVPARDRAHC